MNSSLCIIAFSFFISVASNSALATEKSLLVNGFDMTYIEQGTGSTIVLVHGSVSDNRTWTDVISLLAKDFRVIAPTQRYYGIEDWGKDWPKHSSQTAADDLAEFIRKLETGPVHLAGWSFGARVAHVTALKHPKLIRSAYLFEGVAPQNGDRFSKDEIKEFRTLYGRTFGAYRKALKKEGPLAAIEPFIDAVRSPGAFSRLPEERQRMYRDNARTLALNRRTKVRYKCADIKAVPVPVTLAIGTKTASVHKLMQKNYPPCLPDGSITAIEGVDHGWPGDNPGAFALAVTDFAKKNEK